MLTYCSWSAFRIPVRFSLTPDTAFCGMKCARRGSNPQPSDPKSDALSNCATGAAHLLDDNLSQNCSERRLSAHGYDHFSSRMTLFEVTQRLTGLTKRVRPVYDRR